MCIYYNKLVTEEIFFSQAIYEMPLNKIMWLTLIFFRFKIKTNFKIIKILNFRIKKGFSSKVGCTDKQHFKNLLIKVD